MAREPRGIVRRIRRGKATIDLEIGGSLIWPTVGVCAKTLKIGDKVIIGYDTTTMKLRNIWPEEEWNNVRIAENDIPEDGEEEEHVVSIIDD